MPRNLSRTARAALAGAALTASLAVGVGSAPAEPAPVRSADDASPCKRRPDIDRNQSHFYCPLTRDGVRVYAAPDERSERVGTLERRGTRDRPANWFLFEVVGRQFGPNNWWARTVADNGRVGWVPERYLLGGGTNVPDAGLPENRPDFGPGPV